MLKKLLNDIVAKNVRHKLQCVWLDLAKDALFLVAIGRFELLLNEARAVLVPTKLDYMVIYVLHA